jgi:hypothetical protein
VIHARLITAESVEQAILVGDPEADADSAAWLERDGVWTVAK